MKVLDHGHVRLVDTMPSPDSMKWDEPITAPGDRRIVNAARVSISGLNVRPMADDEKLIRYLIDNRHGSPLEKVCFEFDCKMPIFVARQWIRHRIGSFNEMSARYGELPEEYYVPALDRLQFGGQSKDNKQGSGVPIPTHIAELLQDEIKSSSRASFTSYKWLLEYGVARELARVVLPVNVYTRWFWTVNLRSLFNFLELRLHPHAQWEAREYAKAILQLAEPLAPYAFKAWRQKESIEV